MLERKLKLSVNAMATRFEVVLFGSDEPRLRAAAEEALAEVERIEAQLSIYRPDSELSKVNAKAAQEPVKVDARLFRLIQQAAEVTAETQGAFDMTVTPLLRAWGFTGDDGQAVEGPELDGLMQSVGMRHVHLDRDDFTVRFDTPGVEMDPGAIGKGYAVERAADILREAGIRSALIHGGTSTVTAIGSPPDREGWPIAIRHPIEEGQFLAIINLLDSSLSISSVHGKSFSDGTREYGHVVDPRTGTPTEAALTAAVIGPSATECDALSTALLVLGEPGLSAITRVRPHYRCLVALWDASTEDVRVAHTTTA